MIVCLGRCLWRCGVSLSLARGLMVRVFLTRPFQQREALEKKSWNSLIITTAAIAATTTHTTRRGCCTHNTMIHTPIRPSQGTSLPSSRQDVNNQKRIPKYEPNSFWFSLCRFSRILSARHVRLAVLITLHCNNQYQYRHHCTIRTTTRTRTTLQPEQTSGVCSRSVLHTYL